MWTIDLENIIDWLGELDIDSRNQVLAALQALRDTGPNLGRPLVDTVVASKHKNMKELRPGSTGKSELRILFAFDPLRQAIMLIAGGKSGNWNKWYKRNIPLADKIFDRHIENLRGK